MPARRQYPVSYDEHGVPEPPKARGRDGREKESFDCDYPGCGQTYSRMEYLKRHQRKHQDDRPFQCRDCTKAFARSDVLLRHRRRCHPTPPPTERNTNSPPPAAVRNYPGVPVSSSRTDARGGSPSRSRKRRNSGVNGIVDGHAPQRRRLEDEDDFEEDDGDYGDSSRYRHNGLNDLYSMDNHSYYPDVGESSQYTPHLIPVFQQSGAFPEPRDPNHLEDASVLLSFAYPGGVPPNESVDGNGGAQAPPSANGSVGTGMTVGGQQVVPDWGSGQTIDMMMENATATATRNGTADHSARNDSIASATTNAGSLADGSDAIGAQATLATESMGNFLGTLSWLSAASAGGGGLGSSKEGESAGEGVNMNWAPSPARFGSGLGQGQSPRPLSPWLSSLFSPSLLGMSLPQTVTSPGAGGTDAENKQQQAALQQHAMSILDQLAMLDVPQTKANPNPERPLIRIDQAHVAAQQGLEVDPNSPFFVDAERFATCYRVPHWRMPSVRVLSTMACRTFHTVLNHLSFVHMPTFRLIDTAGCLAFAICTVGGVRANTANWDFKLDSYEPAGDKERPDSIDGPVPPGGTWESMYKKNYLSNAADGAQRMQENEAVEQWRSGPVVRNEKTNMLIKSFAAAKGVLMTEYNVALLQALILYHAPYYLSQDEQERQMANMYLGTVVNISRQIGLFTNDLDHLEPEIAVPSEPHTPNELNMAWRRWIQLETRRRTAFLVYHLDTVSALESNIPCILASSELSYLPLPAPDTLWKAKTADEWLAAVKKYRPMTLDEAMRRTFFLPTFGAFDTMHENADTKYYNLLNESDYGPFARTAMILTLLRGVMDIGEGKRDRGDWRDLTDLWISCSWLRPQDKMLSSDGSDLGPVTRESLKERFTLALQRGWDFDTLCMSGAAATSSAASASPGSSHTSPRSESAYQNPTLNYCEEALPYYWLAQALLNMLKSAPPYEPGYNVFAHFKYGDMLKSARTFTRLGEGVPTVPSFSSSSGASTQDTPASVTSLTGTSNSMPSATVKQESHPVAAGGGVQPGYTDSAAVQTPDYAFLSELATSLGTANEPGQQSKPFDAAAAVAALSGPGDLTAGLEVFDPGMLQGLNYQGLGMNL